MGKNNLLMVFCFSLAAVLAVGAANAALIYGELYDFSLAKVDNVVIEINTVPRQQYVSANGSYSFSVPPGNYKLIARQYSEGILAGSAEENVIVEDNKENGEYVIDLILFPSFEEEEEILAETEFEPEEKYVPQPTNYILLVIALAAIVAFFLILRMKGKELKRKREELDKESKESEGGLKKVISFIKKEGGRTTQKDIRRAFPQSEAKISLILTELEHNGTIKKIKKGRGNVVILK
jgi:uncharacterized membrane protein